jgi:DNA-binding response OmpR family regulator/HPt (histidine-containing phosphotransfer) domain-containing protein
VKILLVDDDDCLGDLLTRSLAAYHYVVDTVKDGEMGWTYGSTFDYDLIVLDIMLPKLDGISLCQRFRAEGYTTPILLLTAQDTSTAKVNGLDAGADDYVVKPFDMAELSARVRALLRRSSVSPLPLLTWGDLLLNPSSCEVTYNGQPLTLTTKEYELLELFMRESQHVFSTDEILGRLWSSEEFPSEATVRSHIRRVRHKLVMVGAPTDFIATVHGRGYFLKASNEAQHSPPDRLETSASSDRHTAAQVEYLAFLNETWLAQKAKILNQLTIFEQAIALLPQGAIPPSLQQQAYHVAHKLAGTLGTFGLSQAMTLARHLEQSFAPTSPPPPMTELVTLLSALQQAIQNQHTIDHLQAISSNSPGRVAPLSSSPDSLEQNTRVMIVDDDQRWLKTLPNLLKPWGFKITTLAEPLQFWTVLQSVTPDLLVLDVNMPDVNGLELCQALRHDPHWQRLPIVFLSGITDQSTQNHAFTLGADDYLCKPVAGVDLANRILNRLRRARAWAT